jgi:hypothetical protein
MGGDLMSSFKSCVLQTLQGKGEYKTEPSHAVAATGARTGSFTTATTGTGLITLARGYFVQLVNRELVEFNVQIGHVTLLLWEGTIPSSSVVAG